MHTISTFIIATGYVGIFLTLFAESGFLLGFFLPGDSLLFTLGILASQGVFNIWLLIILAILGAILGDNFGYWTGKTFGSKLFDRPDSWLFKRRYITQTENFYQKHGPKTILLARLVPIVRTFAPIMAGLGAMNYRTFLTYNIIGGVVWAGGILGLSFFLGSVIPNIEHYLSYIIIGIILVSFIPVFVEYFKKSHI